MTDQGVTPIVPSGTGKLQGSGKTPPPKTTKKLLGSLSRPVAKLFSGSLRKIYRWWLFAVTYCVVLVVGLCLITIRQRAQYVAALDLKADHLIQSTDLRSPINRIPRIFQVDQKIIVGKYLKNDIDSGKAIWQNTVSSRPMVTADAQGDVVQVRLAEGTASARFLQPKSKVVLSSTDSAEKSEGVIIGTSTKTAVRGSKGETGATGERKPSPKPSTQLSPHN